MPHETNETHDPALESWVERANDPESDFPIQNLPYCVPSGTEFGAFMPSCVRIGDFVLDLEALHDAGLIDDAGVDPAIAPPSEWTASQHAAMRRRLVDLLRSDNAELRDNGALRSRALIRAEGLSFECPVMTRDYTDFYASVHHATNVGSMFRPDNPLLPNYKHIPIGYHGRASSIVASGTEVRRPVGQQAPGEDGGAPNFGPCKLLDYEMEMGIVVGRGNELGEPVPIGEAEDRVLGMCILNDWSARDLQKWEYQPLGPFLAKSFASTVSPFLVTMEALAPFRVPAFERPGGDPQPLPYMDSDANRAGGGIDMTVEVHLASAQMRERNMEPVHLSSGNFRDMYWTIAQMVAHHTVNGCNLQSGDLLGSGTISGPTRGSRGSLLELTWDGDPFAEPPVLVPGTQRTPIELPTGESRKFLEDGDEVIMRAFCEREGFRRIGFGECRGIVAPAPA